MNRDRINALTGDAIVASAASELDATVVTNDVENFWTLGRSGRDIRVTERSSSVHKYVYVYPMASKNITVTEDAYDRLKALKREDESFSDLVTRLTEQADPMAFAGSCPGLGARVEEARDELADDLDDTHDELFR